MGSMLHIVRGFVHHFRPSKRNMIYDHNASLSIVRDVCGVIVCLGGNESGIDPRTEHSGAFRSLHVIWTLENAAEVAIILSATSDVRWAFGDPTCTFGSVEQHLGISDLITREWMINVFNLYNRMNHKPIITEFGQVNQARTWIRDIEDLYDCWDSLVGVLPALFELLRN